QEILKNFSEINTNILIKPGSELNTISTMKNILAKATINDNFDREFGIYDLNEFLSVVSSLDKPELTLQEKHMTISAEGSRSKVKYFYSDPSVIVSPTKEVNMPESDVTFSLSESNLAQLQKMAAILSSPDLALIGTKGGDVVLKVCDKKNDTSNKFDIVVGENATANYTFYFKVENLKMISGDYDVAVSSKSIAHFTNTKLPIQYWIALEPDSVFDAG
ncbi:hypothetical protein HX858_09610, partial [Marine Group I thaumarchaeote]|nr:hypothetical protein [Marine Group I thaumarchaeote]